MTYEELLLSDLKEGPVRYYDRQVTGERLPLLQKLQSEGLVALELVEVDEQESYLRVSLLEGEA